MANDPPSSTLLHRMQEKETGILLLIYDVLWTALLAVALPLAAIRGRRRLLRRLGLKLPRSPRNRENLWIHALSVGEVLSAVPLVKSLHRLYPERDIMFTVSTEQGMEVARREVGKHVTDLLVMPLDFWWGMRRIVRYIQPAIFILVETDIWPGLMNHLKKKNIKSVLVNCRISPSTYRHYMKFRPLVRLMYRPIDLCLLQSELDMNRLASVGVENGRLEVSGNIKFDREWVPMDEDERDGWLGDLAIEPQDPLWVAGSTHEGEEEIVLKVFQRLRQQFPRLRLIIAPRRIERSEGVRDMSIRKGFKTVSREELLRERTAYDVLILDTLGELERVYGVASVSFVGGSLVPRGGQNLLEPASFGCPVLFGPHTDDFVLMAQLLIEAGGGRLVKDSEELYKEVKDLLSHPEKLEHMGRAARKFVERNKGALDRVVAAITPLIPPPGTSP